MKYDLQCVALTPEQTDDELRELIRGLLPQVEKTEQGFFVTISGYDFDPRELHRIPEVVEFCKRLVAVGFISLLEISCTREVGRFEEAMPGWGALEVWMSANEKMKCGKNIITHQMKEEFLQCLNESNMICRKMQPKQSQIDPRLF